MPSRAAADLSCRAQPRDGGLHVGGRRASPSLRPRGGEDRPGGVAPVAPCRHVSEQRQPVRHARTHPATRGCRCLAGQVDPRFVRAGPTVQDQRPLAVAAGSYPSRNSRSSPTVSPSCAPVPAQRGEPNTERLSGSAGSPRGRCRSGAHHELNGRDTGQARRCRGAAQEASRAPAHDPRRDRQSREGDRRRDAGTLVTGQRPKGPVDGQQDRSHSRRPRAASPEPGAHGLVADGGGPGRRLERRTRWSAGSTSTERGRIGL
jgi:hypothetical protein